MSYSRFEPFSSVDIPDEEWEANAAQWRRTQDPYDPVAAAQPRFDADIGQVSADDPTAALRGAAMPHQDWQFARARQLAARDGGIAPVAAKPAQSAARPAQAIDPSRAEVFQAGSDGKLHPIPGWHTTGPFDLGQWTHNIDWAGVKRDVSRIGIQSLIGLIPLPSPWEQLFRFKDFYDDGKDTLEDLKRADEQSGR